MAKPAKGKPIAKIIPSEGRLTSLTRNCSYPLATVGKCKPLCQKCLPRVFAPESRKAARVGISVMESSSEAIIESMTAMPILPTNSPVPPGINTMGMKVRAVVKVEAAKGTARWRTVAVMASAGFNPAWRPLL